MNKIEIVADSKNEWGQRITSMVVTFPRFLLAEMNTHRALSRNSASSRAIRFEKMVQSVQDNPFIPLKWQKDHTGMQGTEYFDENFKYDFFSTHQGGYTQMSTLPEIWLEARDHAIQVAEQLHSAGVTKQLCNRLLEPFMYHTALITATEWENFFALRVSEHAEIHFQDIAQKMLDAMNTSEPKRLKAGEWHIPFGDNLNPRELYEYFGFNIDYSKIDPIETRTVENLKVKLAAVRCARISYLNQGKETSIEDDLKLHDRLASSGHWSAFEHCARAMSDDEYNHYYTADLDYSANQIGQGKIHYGWCGNFCGFIQYRKMFEDENRSDSRLLRK